MSNLETDAAYSHIPMVHMRHRVPTGSKVKSEFGHKTELKTCIDVDLPEQPALGPNTSALCVSHI